MMFIYIEVIALSQEGTLLLYPVAKIIESNSISLPSTSFAPLHVKDSTSGTICSTKKTRSLLEHELEIILRNSLTRLEIVRKQKPKSDLCMKSQNKQKID